MGTIIGVIQGDVTVGVWITAHVKPEKREEEALVPACGKILRTSLQDLALLEEDQRPFILCQS